MSTSADSKTGPADQWKFEEHQLRGDKHETREQND
jgi:hypothetical protein